MRPSLVTQFRKVSVCLMHVAADAIACCCSITACPSPLTLCDPATHHSLILLVPCLLSLSEKAQSEGVETEKESCEKGIAGKEIARQIESSETTCSGHF